MSSLSRPETREAAKWLTITTQLYSAHLDRALAAHGLTQMQFSVLQHIARLGPDGTRITAIAAAMQAGQPATTKIVAKFANLRLIEQMPDLSDKRASLVRITDAGRDCLHAIEMALAPDFARMLTPFSPTELSDLVRTLQRLTAWLDEIKP